MNYEEEADMQRALGRIEGKLDSLISKVDDGDKAHDALSIRVGRVEAKQHWYSGVAAAAGVVIGYIFQKPH